MFTQSHIAEVDRPTTWIDIHHYIIGSGKEDITIEQIDQQWDAESRRVPKHELASGK